MRSALLCSFLFVFANASIGDPPAYSVEGLEWSSIPEYVEIQMVQLVDPKGWYWAEVHQEESEHWVLMDGAKAVFKYHHDILNVFASKGFEYVSERRDQYNVYYLVKRIE